MRKIETKFGDLFIEELNNVEEKGRIKIYDSEKRYLDYRSFETLEDFARINKTSLEEEYQIFIERLESDITIENLISNFIDNRYDLITKDWKKTASLLEENSEEELLNNEWVNKIGDYWIVVSEN